MHVRLPRAGAVLVTMFVAACGVSGDTPPADSPPRVGSAAPTATLTTEYLIGEWCQRFVTPEEPGEDPVEERLHLVFEADGVFRIGQSRDRLASLGSWSIDGGVIRMPGNPPSARVTPTRVTEDAFEFRGMGIDVTVTRGPCPPA